MTNQEGIVMCPCVKSEPCPIHKTKQEEVREGIEKRLCSLLTLCGEPLQEAQKEAKELTLAWFQYLHSKGVVIKVDRELPEQPSFITYPKTRSDGKPNMTYQIFKVGQHSLIEAGYVAVEPLIEEEEE